LVEKWKTLLQAVLDLPRADRLKITDELLATMDSEDDEPEGDELADELDRRFEEFQNDPFSAISWSELRDEK